MLIGRLRVRIFGHDDARLVLGLIVAAIVVFARPIGTLLDVAREVERTYGLALIPGLIILVVAMLFHLQDRRQSMKTAAVAASAAADHAEARARELEQLATLGQSVSRALDVEAIRDVLLQQLSALVGHASVWMVVRSAAHWEPLIDFSGRKGTSVSDELADRAMAVASDETARVTSVDLDDHTCFPMIAGGETVGVLGVLNRDDPMTPARRRRVAAAAAVIAVSVRNAQLFREVRDNSLRDGLTGLFNRAHALEVIDLELRRARRSQLPLALIMFDLDHFKSVNDRYGHLGGDAVLSTIAGRLKDLLRSSDMKCRYGGEEFLVLMPETPLAGALQVAESLRRDLAATPVLWEDQTIPVSASIGLTASLPGEVDTARFIARADEALYRAKHEGRNCVRVSAESLMV
jgi:diguanylate cyclase (GGDEF)-like protein